MTSTPTPQILDRVANAPESTRAAQTLAATSASTDRIAWIASILIVLGMYLLLENPYWVPGGDSEVYLAIARNLASGNGYLFNGQPARIAPPGWPMILAGVIKFVSPTFLALKLIPLISMVGAMSIYYCILRRYAPPFAAAGVVLLAATISHVYSLTFWLHSDALFTLITAAMVLLSLQINERLARGESAGAWRVTALLILCFVGAFVRWAGVINLLIVIAALMQGRATLSNRRAWIITALVGAVTVGSFFVIRWGVTKFSAQRVAFEEGAQMDLAAITSDIQIIEGADTSVTQMPGVINTGQTTLRRRIAGFGTWFSYLLWQPFRVATGIEAIFRAATIVGWIVAIIIFAGLWPELKAMRWLLPATLVYIIGLCLNWPQANARYLVPLAPLIVIMIVRGLSVLHESAQKLWQRRAVTVIGAVGLGSVVLCNLSLYGIDLWVMRSRHFYDRYEAGMYKPLIAAAQFLNERHVGHWQTCVNPEYINYQKRKLSPTGLRILTMLTSKAMLQLPRKYTLPPYKLPNDREFRRNFISQNKVRYYLEQPPVNPWRLQHFRVPWLQEKLTGAAVDSSIPDGWRLFICDGASTPVQIALPENFDYPTRVPGF